MQPKPMTHDANVPATPTLDLCSTCVDEENCHLRQMPTEPVHQCNEYDDGTQIAASGTGLLTAVPSPSRTPERAAASPALGLCINCDFRETCVLPRPVGGVWHCEEYQ